MFFAQLKNVIGRLSALAMAVVVFGCASPSNLPSGAAAYDLIPPSNEDFRLSEYRIGALDELQISVFQEEDLSLEKVPVDASGNILFPLIGRVSVVGRTSSELSEDIELRLRQDYLVDPQVTVIVTRSASQKVTVEGAVKKPGVYEIEGQTTLLQAMALSEGPLATARLTDVVVFRRKDGVVYGAKFNLAAIRNGSQPNPQILGNDTVIVGSSAEKAAFRDFLALLPFLGTVFLAIGQSN